MQWMPVDVNHNNDYYLTP